MPNFIDLYRETNPGERRMQSAKGLQDTGFQGIIKSYQMGKGGAEASAYDEKRAAAAGEYAQRDQKRKESMDAIKAMKDGSDIATNMFYSFMEQGDDEATASRKAGEAASDLLYPILGDSAKITNFKPTKDVEYFSMQVSEGNQNVVKFMARDKRSGALAEWNGQSYEPFKGIKLSAKKTAAEQGGAPRTQVHIVDATGKHIDYRPSNSPLKPGEFKASDMQAWVKGGETLFAPRGDNSPQQRGFKLKPSKLDEIQQMLGDMNSPNKSGSGSSAPADGRLPSPF